MSILAQINQSGFPRYFSHCNQKHNDTNLRFYKVQSSGKSRIYFNLWPDSDNHGDHMLFMASLSSQVSSQVPIKITMLITPHITPSPSQQYQPHSPSQKVTWRERKVQWSERKVEYFVSLSLDLALIIQKGDKF